MYFSITAVILFTGLFTGILFTTNVLGGENKTGIADITYYRDFLHKQTYDKKPVEGCCKFHTITGESILRCKEHIRLLRPLKVIEGWLERQKKLGYLKLSINEMGVYNVHGHIKLITGSSNQLKLISAYRKNSSMVTGLFIRHTSDVNTYTFRMKKTGHMSNISVTPNHRFYVKNQDKFIPISQISPEDLLISKTGESVSSVAFNRYTRESNKWDNNIPVAVYNLETSMRHTYFVGDNHVLVHNECSLQEFFKKLEDSGCIYPKEGEDNLLKSIYIKIPHEKKQEIATYFYETKGYTVIKSGAWYKDFLYVYPQPLSAKFRSLGFSRLLDSYFENNDFIWVLENHVSDLTIDEYKTILPFLALKRDGRVTSHLSVTMKKKNLLTDRILKNGEPKRYFLQRQSSSKLPKRLQNERPKKIS